MMRHLLCRLGLHRPQLVGPSDLGLEPRFAVVCGRCRRVRQAERPYWAAAELAEALDNGFIALPGPRPRG